MPRAGFPGEESFIEKVLNKLRNQPISTEVPKKLRPPRGLEHMERHASGRDRAIAGAYTLAEIACYFAIHLATASWIARRKKYTTQDLTRNFCDPEFTLNTEKNARNKT